MLIFLCEQRLAYNYGNLLQAELGFWYLVGFHRGRDTMVEGDVAVAFEDKGCGWEGKPGQEGEPEG